MSDGYPKIVRVRGGWKAHFNKRRSVPGVFTSWEKAKQSIDKEASLIKKGRNR